MVYTDGVHLVSNNEEELHNFAKVIGLKREWFQNHRHKHYDLTTARKSKQAIKAGAQLVTTRQIISILKGE